MYFVHFPKVDYDKNGDGVPTRITDITRRARINPNTLLYGTSLEYYDVQDGETPESVAFDYYGDAGLHWIIMMTNNINDVYTDWPMTVPRLEAFAKSKYDNVDDIHHYEIYQESGDTTEVIEIPNDVAQTIPVDATAITNFEYEQREVEKKRRIKLVRPEYIETVRDEFRKIIRA